MSATIAAEMGEVVVGSPHYSLLFFIGVELFVFTFVLNMLASVWTKKVLQRLGSWVVRRASGTDVPDATSGFRAYTRDAALRLNVVSRFSYTLETLIQAGKSDITVTSVPIRTNPKSRESRLFKSTFQYIKRSVGTIFQIWTMYGPLPAFLWPALVFALGGSVLVGRFLWHYFESAGPTGHVQSLVLGAALLIVAFLLVMLGIISDLLRANRILTERALHRIRHIELALDVPPEKSLAESVDAELDSIEERPVLGRSSSG